MDIENDTQEVKSHPQDVVINSLDDNVVTEMFAKLDAEYRGDMQDTLEGSGS